MTDATTTMRAAVPMLSYEDVGAAVEWLCNAFGFREVGDRYADGEGRVTHAEVALGGALVYLGWPGESYMSPAHHAEVCEFARRWSEVPYIVNGVHLEVDDVDALCERARSAGATILRDPKDEPYGRACNVADLEGHRWMFMTPPAQAGS